MGILGMPRWLRPVETTDGADPPEDGGYILGIATALLLVVHGLIHIPGFMERFELADVPQLAGETLLTLPEALSGVAGALWLVACLLLVSAALMLVLRQRTWWFVAVVGIVVSQLLVIYAWPDAKVGTIPNVLLSFAVVVAWADSRFQRETDKQVRSFLAPVRSVPPVAITAENLDALPVPVRRWMEASGAVGGPIPRSVRLKQRGLLRTSPGQAYMPTEAHQYFRVDEPGFVWRVRVRMMRLIPIAGRDSYVGGRGRMLIKVASLIPVANAADDKIDQGELVRFLSEIVWFPAASLSPFIRWESMDDNSARATMTYRGVSCSAVFSFDERGRFIRLSADRYMGAGPSAKLERWATSATDWGDFGGCLIPIKGGVTWKLDGGGFTYYRWEITEVEYDRPELYASG